MSNGGTDIIIKGSSVVVVFDGTVFVQDPSDPAKHQNLNKKITRVKISGDISYDSGEHPNGLVCTITTTCS